MLSTISNINGGAYDLAAGRAQSAGTRTEAAAAALAALSPAQPLPSASDPFDDDGDALSFLYRPSGLPAGLPEQSEGSSRQSSSGGARLAVESTQLTALLTSLMAPAPATAADETESAAAQQQEVAETQRQAQEQALLPALQQSLIARFYQQF
ncbi:hypothetical protein SAMN05892877_106261 [Rhizobium subbaraonis]|uniref:Uncharacterized protein n=1 Tax=Rhizobium subbaraonis TaxID=908946 RepID=A0A285UDT8_9HYPH|nr:hypothetical protein [Rhizobium subbaraonis]SOC39923.1 hypothetical protein SAMN05892877_106261 [Rhizobium subbaraonis]